MIHVFKKEVAAYFSTPFGFIFIGIFLLLSGIVFSTYNLLGGGGDMSGMFGLLANMSFMTYPILTIKLFPEERRAGTEQLLLTSRLSITDIVLGKYLAAGFVFLTALVVTGIYVVILKVYGYPDLLAIACSYTGFFLLGMTFIAICTFTSSFAENQVTAAISSFGTLVGLVMIGAVSRTIQIPVVSEILSALAITRQYDEFIRGIYRPGPICYFVGFSIVFIYLTIFSLGRRRFA
jgi:ABC-2 type transport system permease protein